MMTRHTIRTGFLLTHDYRDTPRGFVITLYGASAKGPPLRIVIDTFRPPFFVPRDTPARLTEGASERTSPSLRAMDGPAVDCLYFRSAAALQSCARHLRGAGVRTYESDVHPVERYLMERLVAGGFTIEGSSRIENGMRVYHNPRIRGADTTIDPRVLSIDIETCVRTGELYSIATVGRARRVLMRGDSADTGEITYCRDEAELLRRLVTLMAEEDPDVIIGWNVIDFDLRVLSLRFEAHRIPFTIGRGAVARVFTRREGKRYVARVPGRVVLDVPVMLRAYYHTFDSYALDHVATRMLGTGKTLGATGTAKIEEIDRLFAVDKPTLAEYNLTDALLTLEIFRRAGLLADAVERSKHSGHLLDRVGGSVAAFDYLYLPRLHRQGYVALDVVDVPHPTAPLPGGHVMDSKPGIYDNVLLLDFKSLYPTIIKTFLIDPLGSVAPAEERIQGPVGPSFARSPTILPRIIEELLAARARAKRTGNKPLSQAIKILMNSFYGVLGSTGCRFFSEELAGAITGIGRHILRATCAHIEETTSLSVIYGDTDSLFVLVGPGRESEAWRMGERIVEQTNRWLTEHLRDRYSVTSAMELELENHFRHFLMPTIRGSTRGSKKRYCGAVSRNGHLELHFKGMESARSDWTELAKEFQNELYRRVFEKRPLEDYVVAVVRSVKEGRVDDKLVYRKHLRKPLSAYTGTPPPHVQAARLLDKAPRIVRYVITLDGPQPAGHRHAPPDYEHYIDCQLRPVAESVLGWIGLDFDTIVSGQQDLFT